MKFYKDIAEAHPNSKIYDKCWDGHRKVPGKKRGEKGSCEKIKEDDVVEGGYYNPMDQERREQDAMDYGRRAFKRAELQHELGHEDDPDFERKQRQQQMDKDRGPWYIKINGKILKVKGEVKVFDWKRGANNYALAILKNKPELKDKVFLTKKNQDDVKEFAPAGSGTPPRGPKTPGKDPWNGNDGSGDDPYSRPEPEYYSRSIDFFGKFEADHFDKEDFNEKTGVFKGYWENNDGSFVQIAYFKFDNAQQAAQDFNDSPGMGWYYEPVDEGIEARLNTKYSLKNMFGDVKSLDNLSLDQLNKAMDGHVELVGRKFRSQEGNSFRYDVKLANGEWYIMHVVYVRGLIDAWLTDEENNKIPLSKFKAKAMPMPSLDKKITKETQAVTDNSLGYKNTLAVMKAADSSQEATINLGGEPVTLDYPEARFIAGKYKAFLRAGRQEEFFGYMSNPQQFDSMMKQLRNLIDKQKNFKGSVPGERGVDEDAPGLVKAAAGLAVGGLAAAGAPAIVGILGPLLGIPMAAYGAYSAAKLGMAGVEKLWDMATDKLGSSEKVEQYAKAQIAKLPPEKAQAASAVIKQVAESRMQAKESTDYEKSIPAGADESRIKWKCPSCGVASGIAAFRTNNYKCPSCEEPLPVKGQMGLKHQESVSEDVDSPVAGAITRRIMSQRLDLLKQYGPELVGAAIDNVADYVGDVEEIGSSDVSAWVTQVERMLKENPPKAFAESLRLVGKHGEGAKTAKVYKDHKWGEYRVKFYTDGKHEGESADYHTDDRDDAHDTAKSWTTKGEKVAENTYWCRVEKTRKLIPEGYKAAPKGYIIKA